MTSLADSPTTELVVDDHIRDVTDDEVATYEREGWVKLDGLLSPELAGALLEVARDRAGDAGSDEALAVNGAWGEANVACSPGGELFAAMALSPRMGRNAARLVNRSRLTDEVIPTRYFADGLGVRAGRGNGPSTHFHQDYVPQSQDRGGAINIWIALAAVAADQGGMRFLSGSHREARLGPLYAGGVPDARAAANRHPAVADLHYPKLGELYELSDGVVYEPGDATVHGAYTVHCAPANLSERSRWNYLVSYLPDDVRYDGSPNHALDGLDLTKGQTFDHERFPVVHPG